MVFFLVRTGRLAQNVKFSKNIAAMSDDISALITGFGNFRIIRRRLSTICDENYRSEPANETDIKQGLRQLIEYKKKEAHISGIVVEKSVRDLCTTYNEVDQGEKFSFLENLSMNYGTDVGAVNESASSALSSNVESRLKLESELRAALVPDYEWIFHQIGKLENGVKFLVDLRSDLIDLCRNNKSEHLKYMNENLRDLISLWFAIGFLRLERITWESSCDMLEKISEYEAVHQMKNWSDLKQRVGPYRRCFVFTHGSMPTEPVVVLHTALMQNIPGKISSIIQDHLGDASKNAENSAEDASRCDTAIFYSITSTQKGLLGIELGNYLIKRVVKELQAELPKICKFSSLSPIPGFRSWLLLNLKKSMDLVTDEELDSLKKVWNSADANEVQQRLLSCLDSHDYARDDALANTFESILMRLCAVYLVEAKRNGYALDPVAHFHLKNGAVLWRINWLGDLSTKGLNQSCGIMVNYRYFLEDCEKNSRVYVEKQHLSTSQSVRNLLGGI